MSWYEKLLPSRIRTENSTKKGVPEGIWTKCPACSAVLYRADLVRNLQVCPKCEHHGIIGARDRIKLFLDPEPLQEIASEIEPSDILKFRDTKKYKDRLSAAQKKTGEKDALIAYSGKLHGLSVVVCALEFQFIGGSMGRVVGAKFVEAVKTCLIHKCAFICFSASGGARMQEGLFSLMQMAKASAAVAKLNEANLPFISVLTHPTTGGVSASFAMLGDIIIAEPKALIGFTGPRVIEQTVREKLPEGFQRSEFLLEHGAIDKIIDRRELRDRLASIIAILTHQQLSYCPLAQDDDEPNE